MAITTIKLQKETKERLEKLRESRRESYDDIIRKILYVLNVTRESPNKAKNVLERIDELRERMFEEEAHAEAENKKIEAEKKAAKSTKKKVSKK
jgi:predicted transcriptional regulator